MKRNALFINFVLCWLGWGIPMGVIGSILFLSPIKGLILGIVGGLFFGIIMIGTIAIVYARRNKLKERYGIEGTVVYDGGANYLINKEAVGGMIFLTEDSLCFVPHALNLSHDKCIISYSDMVSVSKGGKIRSISINTKEGKQEVFVVNNGKKWISILQEKSRMQ